MPAIRWQSKAAGQGPPVYVSATGRHRWFTTPAGALPRAARLVMRFLKEVPSNPLQIAGAAECKKERPRSKLQSIKELYDDFPRVVTPECFYRGSSPSFAWIPARNMRE